MADAVERVLDGTVADVNSRLAIMLAAERLRRHGLPASSWHSTRTMLIRAIRHPE
ncbi:MAG: hypothetical protein IT306_29030 [Chloroflexi bacterium]|nr:hypothetical protein [Chloroflexota bacterium]